jgi:subtilase family serine protease
MSRHTSRVLHNRGARRCKARIHVEQLEARNLLSFTPKQIVHAYGFDQLYTKGLNGSGQTIALIDAYYDPTIAGDLVTFNSTYGLPKLDGLNGDGTFKQVDLTGNKTQSPAGDDWTVETALDVEWAHAVAPKANILLVEAKSDLTDPVTGEPTDLLNAVTTATNMGANTVSMSWGVGESPYETGWDKFFTAANVSYFAASGDSGAGTIWPAVSPNVVAVGGTTLKLTSTNTVSSETGWGNGIFSFYFGGSGGGFSTYEPLPSYQAGISTVSNGFKLTSFGVRLSPDVSYDADPNTGFNVYDGAGGGWFAVGGTSAGAPQWASLAAIADQGLGSGLSSNQLLKDIYSSSYSSGFRDITSGPSTGAYDVYDNLGNFLGSITVKPQVGYDMVTGQGSPKANALVPLLVGGGGALTPVTPLASTTTQVTPPPNHHGNGGQNVMPPPGSNDGSGTTNTTNTLSTQAQTSASLVASNTPATGASFVQARPSTLAVTQPAPAVVPIGAPTAVASPSRYSAISGSSDRLDDGYTTPELLDILPAEYQENKAAPMTPSTPEGTSESTPMTEEMSRANLDAYFIEASLTENITLGAPLAIAASEQQTEGVFEPAAGVFGMIAMLGGCWSVRDSREEKKKASTKRWAF